MQVSLTATGGLERRLEVAAGSIENEDTGLDSVLALKLDIGNERLFGVHAFVDKLQSRRELWRKLPLGPAGGLA